MHQRVVQLSQKEREIAATSQIAKFETAILEYSRLRSELVGLGSVIGMQECGPTDPQIARLKELTAAHFMAGEEVKALSMTLLACGLLSRCAALIKIHGEGAL